MLLHPCPENGKKTQLQVVFAAGTAPEEVYCRAYRVLWADLQIGSGGWAIGLEVLGLGLEG